MKEWIVRTKQGTFHVKADTREEAVKKANAKRRGRDFVPYEDRKCMHVGHSTGGETRYCQFKLGHKGEHSYANEGHGTVTTAHFQRRRGNE